jgi:threonine aldolase
MLQFMFNAEVGDDVYKQDPTVTRRYYCQILGWKQGYFSLQGLWFNQTAIKLHTIQESKLLPISMLTFTLWIGGSVFNSGVFFCSMVIAE